MSKLLLGVCACAVVACGDDSARHTCGAGTAVSSGMCVGVDGGTSTSCGSGTHLEGDTCVPDPAGGGTAPAIAAIAPTHAGISGLTADGGGVFFEITGSGFTDPKGGAVTVTFGSVKAVALVMDDMTIDGIVPGNTAITAPVTVSNANGNAMIAFTYDALIAADGHGVANSGSGGHAYIIDPTNGFDLDLGELSEDDGSGNQTAMSISGLAFDGDTLYAATTGQSTGGGGGAGLVAGLVAADVPRQLVKLDIKTGAVTIVGPLTDAGSGATAITDLKVQGGTLYATGYGPGPWFGTVDPATGSVTRLGAPYSDVGMGFAFDGSGALWFDGYANSTLEQIDPATGSATGPGTGSGSAVMLDGPTNAIDTMALEGGTIYGVANGKQSDSGGSGAALASDASELVSIDPSTGHVVEIGLIPPLVDAVAAPPATLSIARMAALPWHHTQGVFTAARTCAPLAATTRLPTGSITVTSCDGGSVTLRASSVELVKNRRGQTKLVDKLTRRTLLRNVTSLR